MSNKDVMRRVFLSKFARPILRHPALIKFERQTSGSISRNWSSSRLLSLSLSLSLYLYLSSQFSRRHWAVILYRNRHDRKKAARIVGAVYYVRRYDADDNWVRVELISIRR